MLALFEKPFRLTVSGNSMFPIIQDGEKIEILPKQKTYEKGDIVVFYYKSNIIVHRILIVDNKRYYCKGDNSFRLEDVSPDFIIGKVNIEKDPNKTDTFILDSLKMHETFRRNGYDIDKTQSTKEYMYYKENYLSLNKE